MRHSTTMRQGEVIDDRFEIEQLVGSIGLAEVYRAHDRASGEVVAAKVLHHGEAYGAARVMREGEVLARLLAELHHPGVVRYVAHGITASGAPYVATEWLEGEDLARRLERQRLAVDETVTLVSRAAGALAAVHARGIVHRNLKPRNLFLVGCDVARVKLLDFELARLPGATRITKPGAVVGAVTYMAPEQVRGDFTLDMRADVFALGCVLFECLTGAPLFTGEHVMAVLAKILFEGPPRVRDLRPEVPSELDALCAWMLATDPEERPRDGAAVAAALDAVGVAEAADR